ncbi:MAG: glycosyltransferase, partial [Bacteroidota bacterium]|nr:glycosyltransferase [Bacteroidota bacterium]
MNVIFLTMVPIPSLSKRGIYTDLLRRFVSEGHKVYVVYPRERRLGQSTELYNADGATYIGVRTLNLQKSSTIEKGIGQVLVEGQYKRAIKKYLSDIQFDLVLYSTPPITFPNVLSYLKKKNSKAITYLLLKDIFPQNAVDLGMMTKTGIKGLLYKFFRNKEKKLYAYSDYIGCMSPANVEYVLKHNPEISADRVEVAPNSVELNSIKLDRGGADEDREYIRKRYGMPTD